MLVLLPMLLLVVMPVGVVAMSPCCPEPLLLPLLSFRGSALRALSSMNPLVGSPLTLPSLPPILPALPSILPSLPPILPSLSLSRAYSLSCPWWCLSNFAPRSTTMNR